jgi:anti-anti-sigma regulatory factor
MWQNTVTDGVNVVTATVRMPDSATVERALAQLEQLVNARPDGRWVVDASAFDLLNSDGIALLIRMSRRVNVAGGRLALAQTNAFVRGVLMTLRITKIVPMHETVAAAVAELKT